MEMAFKSAEHPDIVDMVLDLAEHERDKVKEKFDSYEDKVKSLVRIRANVNWALSNILIALDEKAKDLDEHERPSLPFFIKGVFYDALDEVGIGQHYRVAPCVHCHAEGIARARRGRFKANAPNNEFQVKELIWKAIEEYEDDYERGIAV